VLIFQLRRNMKYGEYLQRVRGNFQPEFLPEDFVDYAYVKDLASKPNEAEFYKAWESELVRVARKVKVAWSPDLNPDTDRKMASFKAIHREAFRKLAKACDKANLENPENGWTPQQELRLRMVDCVFSVSQPTTTVEDVVLAPKSCDSKRQAPAPSEPDPSSYDGSRIDDRPHVIGVQSDEVLVNAGEVSPSKSKSGQGSKQLVQSYLTMVGMGVFYALVASQPMLSDLTKDGPTFQYIESTVILAEAGLSCSIGMVGSRKLVRPWDVVRYSPVGILRAIEDTLSLVCLNYVDPTLYMALAQSRLVLTGLATRFLLRKSLNRVQWQGMSVITLGLVGFSLSYEVPGDSKIWGILLVMVAVVCKVAASVYVDWILHKDHDVSVIYQSATISFSTVFPGCIYIAIFDRTRMSAGPFSGWNGWVCALVVVILAKNWLSNIIVKKFSAVTKYVIYAAAVAGTYALQLISYGQSPKVLPVLLIAIIIQGCLSFADGKNWSLNNASGR